MRWVLDVNTARVVERFVTRRRLADIRYDPWLQAAARGLVRDHSTEQADWAVLDFTALICKARTALCHSCPVSARCSYFPERRPIDDRAADSLL